MKDERLVELLVFTINKVLGSCEKGVVLEMLGLEMRFGKFCLDVHNENRSSGTSFALGMLKDYPQFFDDIFDKYFGLMTSDKRLVKQDEEIIKRALDSSSYDVKRMIQMHVTTIACQTAIKDFAAIKAKIAQLYELDPSAREAEIKKILSTKDDAMGAMPNKQVSSSYPSVRDWYDVNDDDDVDNF